MERNSERRSAAPRPGLGGSSTAARAQVMNGSDGEREHSTAAKRAMSRKSNRWVKYLIAAVVVIAVIVALVRVFDSRSMAGSVIDRGKYQAVFLSTGEVYFGKLSILADGFFKLNDVYYVQKKAAATDESDSLQNETAQNDSALELMKLGSEMHKPIDTMVINRDQVLYFENIDPEGTVAKRIAEEKQQNKR